MSTANFFPGAFSNQLLSFKMSGELPHYFNIDEMAKILSEEFRQENYDSWFLTYFLYHTGARISEAVGDSETKDGELRIIHPGLYVSDFDFYHRVENQDLKTAKS